ncbi:MAG: hypothetical protein J1F71_04385 [Clostridiales bacterium]|nr:hypothetical protein [Clostridiales bacterium]
MEIAELVLSCISTAVAVISFIFAFIAKKTASDVKREISFIIKNNPDLKVSLKNSEKMVNKVDGNNNVVANGDINGK